MSCDVGCKHRSDPVLLWLWCRRIATAQIQPLAWELLCAVNVALKGQNKRKEKVKRNKRKKKHLVEFASGKTTKELSQTKKNKDVHVTDAGEMLNNEPVPLALFEVV